MAAVNYYLGLKRGDLFREGQVQAGTATVGTAVDVELRIQTNDGSNATGITRQDVKLLLKELIAYIEQGGVPGIGATYLPIL